MNWLSGTAGMCFFRIKAYFMAAVFILGQLAGHQNEFFSLLFVSLANVEKAASFTNFGKLLVRKIAQARFLWFLAFLCPCFFFS